MRHDTPAASARQSTAVIPLARRSAAVALVTTCLAGAVLAFTPTHAAAHSHVTHATRRLADSCTSSSGPCLPIGW